MIDSEKLTAWYDFQASFYSLRRDRNESPVVKTVAEGLREKAEQGRLLDAGCGTGLFSIGLAQLLPGWHIEGVDSSEGMLEIARKRAATANLARLRLRQADITALPLADNDFDAIVAGGLFPNLNDHAGALREFYRILRPGAVLWIIEYNRNAMTAADRLMFRTMIFGYKCVSALFRRFRFAEEWNIESSTINCDDLRELALEIGFNERRIGVQDAHWILEFSKGEDACRNSR